MNWQQIVMIILLSWGPLLGLILHGQQRTGKYNFFSALFAALIEAAILYTGGFWG